MRIKLCIAFLAASAAAASGRAESIYALLNNEPGIGQQLVTFESTTGAVTSTVLLQTANTLSPLASIDVRPANGQLYGYDATARQLFTIIPGTGALTAVGSPLAAGSIIGGEIDFNPTNDLIRLIGAADENLRLDPTTGALAGTDTTLVYAAGDANFGDNPNIRAAGYTNSFAGAPTTTLYDIDVDNDALLTQTPANSGLLQTVGALGVNLNTGLFGTFTSFDVSGTSGIAYLTDGAFASPSNFYQVDLATGAATPVGAGTITGLPTGRTVAAIAVASPVPEPATIAMAAMAAAGVLISSRRRS